MVTRCPAPCHRRAVSRRIQQLLHPTFHIEHLLPHLLAQAWRQNPALRIPATSAVPLCGGSCSCVVICVVHVHLLAPIVLTTFPRHIRRNGARQAPQVGDGHRRQPLLRLPVEERPARHEHRVHGVPCPTSPLPTDLVAAQQTEADRKAAHDREPDPENHVRHHLVARLSRPAGGSASTTTARFPHRTSHSGPSPPRERGSGCASDAEIGGVVRANRERK
mmetsp:Transcript_15044/g.37464  ORF Transcript_15044/g.37464 Transcript_15044/m.37464 type:complete len:220 (+) Transcript_15044:867-1526(+)